MNERIKDIAEKAGLRFTQLMSNPMVPVVDGKETDLEKFAELLVEAVLDQVKERAYYTGDRDWSDEVDRPWIQLEFGYGKLYNAKHFGV